MNWYRILYFVGTTNIDDIEDNSTRQETRIKAWDKEDAIYALKQEVGDKVFIDYIVKIAYYPELKRWVETTEGDEESYC